MIVVGDLHLRNQEVYYKAGQKLLNYLDEQFPDEILIFLGDVFDNSSPEWYIYSMFKEFLKGRLFPTYILRGNHDNSKRKGCALNGLHLMDDVNIFFDMEIMKIENFNCLFLPYPLAEDKANVYRSLDCKYDFIFTHITPPECAFAEEGIELKTKGIHIHGHTHIAKNFKSKITGYPHYVLGVPYATRNGENQEYKVIRIKEENETTVTEFVTLPVFLNIETVKYGEMPKNKDWLYNVVDAPSYDAVYDMYKDYYLRDSGIEIIKEEGELTIEDLQDQANQLKIHFAQLAKEKNLSKDIVEMSLFYLDQLENNSGGV